MAKTNQNKKREASSAVQQVVTEAQYELPVPAQIDQAIFATEKRLERLKTLKNDLSENSLSVIEQAKTCLDDILK
jgi:hypothetical protein